MADRLRARDADRAATCAALDAALVDGALDTVEHRERVGAAMTAVTLRELAALTEDLQRPAPPAARPRSRRRPGVVAAAVVLVLGLGAAGWVTTSAGEPVARPGYEAPAEADLFGAAGWEALLTWLRTEQTGTVVAAATVYPTYARVEVLEPDDPRHTRQVHFPARPALTPLRGSRPLDGPLVDLAATDHGALRALLAAAPDRLGVADPTSVHVAFGFPTRPPDQLAVHVSDDHGVSGMLVATLGGEVVSVSTPSGS